VPFLYSRRVYERDLEELFDRYGRIHRVDIKNGFGFVEFEDSRDAEDAIRGEDGRDFFDRRIQVEPSRGNGPRRSGPRYGGQRFKWRLEVEGLNPRTSWQDLKDFARKAGEVAFTNVKTSRGKKIGVIEYTNEDDMIYALKKLDDTKLDGEYIRLYEEGKEEDSRSPPRKRRRSSGSTDRKRRRDDDEDDDRKRRDDDDEDRTLKLY